MKQSLIKVLLFIPMLLLFQLVLAGLMAIIAPIINLGQVKFEGLGHRTFTYYFMGLWIGAGFYWALYLFFVLFPKLNKANWHVVFHLLMAFAFTFQWGQNAGGLIFLGIPLFITTCLNFFFLRKIYH